MSGYESTRIGGGEHPDSWEHPDINSAFEPLDTTDATNQAQKYGEVYQKWEQGVETFARSIQASISQAWSGPAAERAKEAIADYARAAHQLTPALGELRSRVNDAANAIVHTKNSLPDPVVVTWTSWSWPPHRWDLQDKQRREAEAARTAMRTNYVEPFGDYDAKIPVLPTPLSPTQPIDIPAPPPGGWPSGNGGAPSSSPGTSQGTDSGSPASKNGAQPPAQGQPDNPQPAATNPSGTSTDQTSPVSTTQNPSTTGAPGTTDPAKTTPSTTNTSTVPGGPGRSGSPGGPSRSGGPSAPGGPGAPQRSGEPGRSIAGRPNMPGAPANPAAAAAAAGTRGAAGTPGFYPPGAARGKQDDESDRKIPDYLITEENTEELLGEPPRTLPDGVIGGHSAT